MLKLRALKSRNVKFLFVIVKSGYPALLVSVIMFFFVLWSPRISRYTERKTKMITFPPATVWKSRSTFRNKGIEIKLNRTPSLCKKWGLDPLPSLHRRGMRSTDEHCDDPYQWGEGSDPSLSGIQYTWTRCKPGRLAPLLNPYAPMSDY